MKTRVSIINYSNTIPFSYGLLKSAELAAITEFSYGYPAQVAQSLCSESVDASIISVAAIPQIPNAHVFSKYCISATQRVDSVLLCSNKPLDKISHIILDYQSRTSNVLVQILAKEAWNISPQFVMGSQGYELLQPDSAKVIIGDRALLNAHHFEYVYDLANEWYKAFGTPFVFATWVSNKILSDEFVQLFENACEYGVNHIKQAIQATNKTFQFNIHDYLTHSVEFELTPQKREVIEVFIEKGKYYGLLD